MSALPPGRCRQPDRHVPKIECGYPLPCPHHTNKMLVGEAVIEVHGDDGLTKLLGIADVILCTRRRPRKPRKRSKKRTPRR